VVGEVAARVFQPDEAVAVFGFSWCLGGHRRLPVGGWGLPGECWQPCTVGI
jgi:hypothetical protein